ncbi:MAG: aminoglycoside phosphotransferase family protein [Candidatus Nomurabacteria bacterium]|nr:aminoglycoside phosphotransferase family protein [Candidatus Nomurabacteria bacterium]
MSTVKTKIDQDLVLSFLRENFDPEIKELEFLKGGESSQAFAFNSKGLDLVARVNKGARSFYKDEYASKYFTKKDLPIPEIIETVKLDDIHYVCISKRALGQTINLLPEEEYQKILPELISILGEINSIDISDSNGFGKWNKDGLGESESWKDFILAVGTHINKDELFNTSFLEKDVWDKIYSKIEELVEFCPEERFLIHSDYGSNNVVSNNGKITGILDWGESMYGDFIYDVAWLSFWSIKNDPNKNAEQAYRDMNLENFEERLLCYKLRIGLGSLAFYAYSEQKDKYESIKERTLNLLK